MGYRPADESDSPPEVKGTGREKEPYPIVVWGEKLINDTKLHLYIDSEFLYYVNIYENNKMFGIPYKNWMEMPEWMIWISKTFAALEQQREAMAYGKITK
ncbi:MAG: hypothetical protein FWC64_07040 [Treponema sp.]|nr:hypothetical protein [Treponema sp.]